MTTRAIIRLAQIAREYDLAGRPREADVIEAAMMRLADGSAVGNWWDGVKQIGTGMADNAKAWGNAVAAPFEGAPEAEHHSMIVHHLDGTRVLHRADGTRETLLPLGSLE